MMHHGSYSLPCEAGEGWGGGARSAATRGCQLPSPACGGRPGRGRRDVSTREIVSSTARRFASALRCPRIEAPGIRTRASTRRALDHTCDALDAGCHRLRPRASLRCRRSLRHTVRSVPDDGSGIRGAVDDVSSARGTARCRWKRFGGLVRGAGSMSFACCGHCVRFPQTSPLNPAPSPTLPRFAREGARVMVHHSVRSS